MNLGVIPAAGRSSRLGRNKALLALGRSVVLDRLVQALQGGGVDRIVVVAAEGDDALQAHCAGRRIRCAINPHPEDGMLPSILCGVRELGSRMAPSETLVICPVDYPAVRRETVRKLIACVGAGRSQLAVPVREGRRGHPLALRGALRSSLFDLDLHQGLRQLLDRHSPRSVEVDDPGIHQDLDSWTDYETLNAWPS